MQLLCVGDVAPLDTALLGQAWPVPGEIRPGEDARVLFNWELPIGEKLNARPRTSGPRLMVDPRMPSILRRWSPGIAALATNHILDGGPEGLLQTISTLNQAGFTTFGAGRTADEAAQPLHWETREGCLAVINWVFPETHPDWQAEPGPNCWPGIAAAQAAIRALKHSADWVMLILHWSDEAFSYPRLADRQTAEALINAGADLIIGHHPHVVRGMEIMHGCPVFYSLGNFHFSDIPNQAGTGTVPWPPRNREALGVRVTFRRGEKPQVEPLSFWQSGQQTLPDPSRRAVRRMNQASQPLHKRVGEPYAAWYRAQRARFDKVDYRLHFSFYQLGWKGLLRYPFQLLNSVMKSSH